jgi:ferredoxin
VLAALTVLAVLVPVGLMPKASFSVMEGEVPLDLFYNAWLIPARRLPAWITLTAWSAAGAALLSVPWWWKPAAAKALVPAASDENRCTGCTQCYQDCPYEAIAMVPAPPSNTATSLVARVNPALCVSCGICAGSCAPMVIGPPGRSGRDLLGIAQRFAQSVPLDSTDVIVMACTQGLEARLRSAGLRGVQVLSLHCAGASHTAAIEYLLRRGVGGVYVLACPDRDCSYRLGPRWMRERLFNDREAELQERVDKRRVRLGPFSKAEWNDALADLLSFQEAVRRMAHPGAAEDEVDLAIECEPVELPRARWPR